MEPSSFQNAADPVVAPYSDNERNNDASLPSILITPPSTPPPFNSAIARSPNQSSVSPYHALVVPPSPSDLEKGLPRTYVQPTSTAPLRTTSGHDEKDLPPSYVHPHLELPAYTSTITANSTLDYNTPPAHFLPPQSHNRGNQLIVLLPNETTHLYLSTTSPSSAHSSIGLLLHPSWFQILSFVHVSSALLIGIEVLDLLYLHHLKDFDVLGGGIFGAPLALLWWLLGAYFGTGFALFFL